AINSRMAMAGGTLAALIVGRNDPGFVHNGPLAGLVAICAGSDVLHPIGPLARGARACALCVALFTFTQNRLKIDDVLGVWPLHGVCGAWGGIAAGIFGLEAVGGVVGVTVFVQLGGSVLIAAYAFAAGLVIYALGKRLVGIRLTDEQQRRG